MLSDGWLIRFATADDAERLKENRGIVSKGKGGTVEGHVSGDHNTKYISAARTQGGARRYIAGNNGVMLINIAEANRLGATLHDTDWVVRQCESPETEANAGKAREYLFELAVPGDAIVYSPTVPKQKFEKPRSRRGLSDDESSSSDLSDSDSDDEPLPRNEELVQEFQGLAFDLEQAKKASRQAGIKRRMRVVLKELRRDFHITIQNSNPLKVIKVAWSVPSEVFEEKVSEKVDSEEEVSD